MSQEDRDWEALAQNDLPPPIIAPGQPDDPGPAASAAGLRLKKLPEPTDPDFAPPPPPLPGARPAGAHLSPPSGKAARIGPTTAVVSPAAATAATSAKGAGTEKNHAPIIIAVAIFGVLVIGGIVALILLAVWSTTPTTEGENLTANTSVAAVNTPAVNTAAGDRPGERSRESQAVGTVASPTGASSPDQAPLNPAVATPAIPPTESSATTTQQPGVLRENPQSLPGRLIGRARDAAELNDDRQAMLTALLAAVNEQPAGQPEGTEAPAEEVFIPSAEAEVTTREIVPSNTPAPVVALEFVGPPANRGATSTTGSGATAPRASPEIRQAVARLFISGTTSQRIIIDGNFFNVGDIVLDDPAPIRWLGRDADLRVLYFEGPNGYVYEKDY